MKEQYLVISLMTERGTFIINGSERPLCTHSLFVHLAYFSSNNGVLSTVSVHSCTWCMA